MRYCVDLLAQMPGGADIQKVYCEVKTGEAQCGKHRWVESLETLINL